MGDGARTSKRLVPKCGMTKKARERAGLRQCPDIGMWAIDNGMGHCVWRTEACKDCYNRKTTIYKDMARCWSPGGLDDQRWTSALPSAFSGLHRVRLNTRGEAFSAIREVDRVSEWLEGNPSTKFWIVTRAWQTGMHGSPEKWYRINEGMIRAIEQKITCFPNAYVMLSIDDWTKGHWKELKDRGFGTIYFSRDLNRHPALGLEGANVHKCRKTWDRVRNPATGRWMHRKGVCKACRSGCFSDARVDVWLKFHW